MITEKGRKAEWKSAEAELKFRRSKKNPEVGTLKVKAETGDGLEKILELKLGKESASKFADAVDEALDENSRKRIVETETGDVGWRISKRKGRAGGKPAGFLVSVRKRIGRGGSFLAAEFPVDGDGLYELLYFACACAGEEIGEEEMEIEDE